MFFLHIEVIGFSWKMTEILCLFLPQNSRVATVLVHLCLLLFGPFFRCVYLSFCTIHIEEKVTHFWLWLLSCGLFIHISQDMRNFIVFALAISLRPIKSKSAVCSILHISFIGSSLRLQCSMLCSLLIVLFSSWIKLCLSGWRVICRLQTNNRVNI